MGKSQISFTIDDYDIEIIDSFIEGTGFTRSKFIAHLVRSAASSIRNIQSVRKWSEFDEETGMDIPFESRGSADMKSAIEVIEAIAKIKEAVGHEKNN